MKGYWDRHKQGMFPSIKDWSKPQNHIRKKNIHKQTQKEWFWFSSDSYKLVYYGNNIISMLMFYVIAAYFFKKEIFIFTTLFVIIGSLVGVNLMKKISNYKNIKDMTFYDLYLREY